MHEALRKYVEKYSSMSLTDKEFEIVHQAFTFKKLRKKQYFLQEGDVAKQMAFILKGSMRMYTVNDKGHETIIQFGIENWWIGDRESFFMLSPSPYNIDALEDCELLVLNQEHYQQLLNEIPAFVKMVRVLDMKHHIATQKRIHASIGMDAEEKYQDFVTNHPEFLQRFPQNMIASYLGISPETLTRIRKRLLYK
ncbi:Crp/Fnr family transcriptional regulator [Xanthocytophaga agilis]|uniref:Crp/Fnr family transcriptional regulator n=1 Tax=Xanthocytophaga agilis TaxID=3048010 RepID=A0AAE3QWD6_9BACT|nr:Crp/Fnr family transcriptional regulator [Xanthocytophaga agilis]MDJ1499289.1 Crp/Fnr family transcriptional regulator [Xanthocytophaga agilis]